MRKTWVQCELALSPGAEPWLLVRYRGGMFRVPADTCVSELVRGIENRWQGLQSGRWRGHTTVTPQDASSERVSYLRGAERS